MTVQNRRSRYKRGHYRTDTTKST